MRKACAQAGYSVLFVSSSNSSFFGFGKFIRNLSDSFHTAFAQPRAIFAQPVYSASTVVARLFSTASTQVITITTFYKKDSLITYRGIS
jgi:hypothetical protein